MALSPLFRTISAGEGVGSEAASAATASAGIKNNLRIINAPSQFSAISFQYPNRPDWELTTDN
jgi:hypothetical protein